jgi:predicted Zn finger-like uncharacterized protein
MFFGCQTCGVRFSTDESVIPLEGGRFRCPTCGTLMKLRRGSAVEYTEVTGISAVFDLRALLAEVDGRSLVPSVENRWFIMVDGSQVGPLDQGDLGGLVDEGTLLPSTQVWRPGQQGWLAAGRVEALEQVVARVRAEGAGGGWRLAGAAGPFLALGLPVRPLPVDAEGAARVLQAFAERRSTPLDWPEPELRAPRALSLVGDEGRFNADEPAQIEAERSRVTPRQLLTLLGGVGIVLLLALWIGRGLPQAESESVGLASNGTPFGAPAQAADEAARRDQQRVLSLGKKRLGEVEKQAVVEEGRGRLLPCLALDLPLGPVSVSARIKPNGAPFSIAVDGAPQIVVDCLRQRIASWRFPTFRGDVEQVSFTLDP